MTSALAPFVAMLDVHGNRFLEPPDSATVMARDICQQCQTIVTVGFTVPWNMWGPVCQGRWSALCLGCYTRAADALRLPWARHIGFWPVDQATIDHQEVLHRRAMWDFATGEAPR